MLSRIAEALFWIGRYVERADDTARIVDILQQQLLEETGVVEEAACRAVLAVMGVPPHEAAVGRADVRDLLVLDGSHTSSITGAWQAARENARRARETLSTELWEAVNATWHRWPREVRNAGASSRHLAWVRERAALVCGIADSTMSHDEAWYFIVLGRSIERADMTARLVATGAIAGTTPAWTTLLRSCGAYQAYLRTHRGVVTDERAAGFLLLDRLFPRSVLHALTEAERCLGRLAPSTDRQGVSDEARRQLGRARTSLEYRALAEVLADLPAEMRRVQQACSAATDAVARRYFPAGVVQTWTGELP